MFEFLPCLHYFDEEFYSCTEMVSTVIRKTGKTQVKRKFPPASNATVIDWSFDAADNYCQNGQEISRHRRATSFTRANERGHT